MRTALPLEMTHGWPGSVAEFASVIGPLADPVSHSAAPGDAFHVVCPSLPGYGFSDKPAEPGWSTSIGQQAPGKCSVFTSSRRSAPPGSATFDDLTGPERSALESLRLSAEADSGYSAEHATRPQAIGYALTDSPVALAAWVTEKFWAWTDHDGDLETVISRDELLDNLMLYWLPRTGASAARLYWESIRQVNQWISGEVTDTVSVPVGCSIFPREL